MALLKPNPNQKKVGFKVRIGESSIEEINEYCRWAGFDDQGEFIEKVVEFMIDKDVDWKKYRKEALGV